MSQKRVLLIDDNEDITRQIGKYLNIKGYDYVESNSGRNGLEILSNSKFDYVILDLAMPNFTGYDVIEQIEEKKMLNDFVLVVLTASEVSDSRRNELQAKNIKILEKPIQLKELISILENS